MCVCEKGGIADGKEAMGGLVARLWRCEEKFESRGVIFDALFYNEHDFE